MLQSNWIVLLSFKEAWCVVKTIHYVTGNDVSYLRINPNNLQLFGFK